MNILCIPDSHSDPDTDNRRFDWLGNMILEVAPDVIVNIGDHTTLNSLSSYDKGKRTAELRRYRNDLLACHDSLERINKPLDDYNKQRKSIRKGQRKVPLKYLTLGNHEDRIRRAAESSPELIGTLSISDLKYEEYGWQVIPFKQPIEIEGIWFSHYWPSGVKGEPLSGFNIAALSIQRNMVSSVCGHSHLFDYAIRAKPNGDKVIGLCIGCYLEEPTYIDATSQLWWSGITLLRNVKNGVFDIETYSIDRIQQLYS